MIAECPVCRARYDVTGQAPGTGTHCRCGALIPIPTLPETARSINCPQCGASSDPNSIRCEFCQAHLAVISCPRCFDLLFIGAKHCPNCGAKVEAPAYAARDAAASPRVCPRCGSRNTTVHLSARITGETMLDQCSECGGVWLDMDTFDHVLEEQNRRTALKALGLPRAKDNGPASMSMPIAYLRCPACEQMMHRKNFGKRSGIIIDTCKHHGVWFDRGELAGVLEFVAKGGLEESHLKDLQALKEEVARQRSESREPSWMSMPVGGHQFDTPHRGLDIVALIINFLQKLFRGF